MRKLIPIFVGTIIIVASVYGFSRYMKGYELDVTMMDTIKPTTMIQAGQLITRDLLRIEQIPTVQHMDNAVIDLNEIVGKRAIVPIGEMEEILSWKIGPDTLYPKQGETYLGFQVDFVGAVNNMVRRGDKVDVYVEYNSPKLLDALGNEIDPDDPTYTLDSMPEVANKIYSEKIITGLTVAYVKDQDGKEIVDVYSPNSFGIPLNGIQRDAVNMERYRQGSMAQPSYITFILNDDEYYKIAEGQKKGIIKFGLPLTGPIGSLVTNQNENGDQDQEAQADSEGEE